MNAGELQTYLDAFDGIKKLKLPKYFSNTHVWHLFVIEVANRNKFIAHCKDNNIETKFTILIQLLNKKLIKIIFKIKKYLKNHFLNIIS